MEKKFITDIKNRQINNIDDIITISVEKKYNALQRYLCMLNHKDKVIECIINMNCSSSLSNIIELLDINDIKMLFNNSKCKLITECNLYRNINIIDYSMMKENNKYLREYAIEFGSYNLIMNMISEGYIFNHDDLNQMYMKNNRTVKYLLHPKYNKNLFNVNFTRILDIAIYKNDIKMISLLKKIGCSTYKHHKILMRIYMGKEIKVDYDYDDIIVNVEELIKNKGLIEIKYIASSLCIDINQDYNIIVKQINEKGKHNNGTFLNDITCLGTNINDIPAEKLFISDNYAFELNEVLKYNINPYTRNNINVKDCKIIAEKYKSKGYCIPIIDNFTLLYEKLQCNIDKLEFGNILTIMYINGIISFTERNEIKNIYDLSVVYNILKIIEPNKIEPLQILLNCC